MTPASAKKAVLLTSGGTALMSAITAARAGSLPARRMVLGALVVALALSALAEAQPDVAAGIGTVMLITSVFVLGGDAMTGITAMVATTPATPVTPTTPGN